MKASASLQNYTIKDIIDYRELSWTDSKEFLFLTQLPLKYETDFVRPDYYCFGLITQGKLEININNELYDLSPNSIMVYRPGQLWKVAKIAEGTTGWFVLFSKQFLNALNDNIFAVKNRSFLSQGISSLIELNDADHLKIESLFKEIFAVFQHLSKSNWELVARNLTSALIYEADDILEKYIHKDHALFSKEDELFSRFYGLLAIDFKANRKPEYYASRLNVTANYLYAVTKKATGKTPTELINGQVISEAKYQVAYTLKNFTEIAYDLHFCDLFTFSKFFKKHTHFAPSLYRKNVNNLILTREN